VRYEPRSSAIERSIVTKSWLCVKCLHEFPDDVHVKRQPEYVGMVIFLVIGLAAILFGAGAIFVVGGAYTLKGILLAAGGFAVAGFGWQLKTGLKAICPNCGRPQGIPGHTKSADEIRRRGKKN
jgi:hypothetical protein